MSVQHHQHDLHVHVLGVHVSDDLDLEFNIVCVHPHTESNWHSGFVEGHGQTIQKLVAMCNVKTLCFAWYRSFYYVQEVLHYEGRLSLHMMT